MAEATVLETAVDEATGLVDLSSVPEAEGVYAIHDAGDNLCYIGLSRKMFTSVQTHAKVFGMQAQTAMATVRHFHMPGASREELKDGWQAWLAEHIDAGGSVPLGNLPDGQPGADPRWRGKSMPKAPLDLGGFRGITNEAEAREATAKAIGEHPVVLFMKGSPAQPACGFSKRSAGILQEIGVDFEAVNVMDFENNPGVREAVKAFAGWPTIPQLYVRGELIGGADIITEMHQAGELAPTLAGSDPGGVAAGETSEFRGEVLLVEDPARPQATALSRRLSEALELRAFTLVDESDQHAGHAGSQGLDGESHFRLEVVAPEFDGLSPVDRQRLVYEALEEVMPNIHALALVTRTPAEAARSR